MLVLNTLLCYYSLYEVIDHVMYCLRNSLLIQIRVTSLTISHLDKVPSVASEGTLWCRNLIGACCCLLHHLTCSLSIRHPHSVTPFNHTKSIFARHGIPQEVISDGGPQFSSQAYERFAEVYGFTHRMSSPYYPQANEEAERVVKTIKSLLRKGDDPYLALLAYRTTPLQCSYSPAELLMNRQLRTTVPITPHQLRPIVPYPSQVRSQDNAMKEKQKRNFDKHHGTWELETLDEPGIVVHE